MEEGAIGIELTSFTKKDTALDESGEQKSTQAEGSCDVDILDDKFEPITDTDMGQERSATEEVSEYFIHQNLMAKICSMNNCSAGQIGCWNTVGCSSVPS